MKIRGLSLFALLAALVLFATVTNAGNPMDKDSVNDAEESLDNEPESRDEAKELKRAEADVTTLKAKVAHSKAKYEHASQPFKPSERLLDLQENATKAEEVLQDAENDFEEANETLLEDRKEENVSKTVFVRANGTDLKLRNKILTLQRQLKVAMEKEARVKEAHNMTVQAYKAHRLADAKIKLSAKLKDDADAVTESKVELVEETQKLKAQLLEIKTALHGEDPHTKALLITIAEEKNKLRQLPKEGEGYHLQKEILDKAIQELYAINGKKTHVVAMKKKASALAKSIKKKRGLVADAEERVHRDAGILQEMTNTSKIPEGLMDTSSAGTLNEKALVLKDIAVALNVTGTRNALSALAKKYQKRHNTTFKKAMAMYNSTRNELENATNTFILLEKKLFQVRIHYKNAAREMKAISAAERASYAIEKSQAAEMLHESEIGLKLAQERVQRAKEVLAALKRALQASSSTEETIKSLMAKPEAPSLPGKKFPVLEPSAAGQATDTAEKGPASEAIDQLVKEAFWGNKLSDSQVAHVESVLKKSFHKKHNSNGTAPPAAAKAMKFKQLRAQLERSETYGVEQHCLDGVKNFDEVGVDCGGSCPRKCGYHRVQTVESSSDNAFHVVANTIPNHELVGKETIKPTMVKSLKDLLVPGADVTTSTRADTVPVMNDGKFQEVRKHTEHRFKELGNGLLSKHNKMKHHLRHRVHKRHNHHRHHHRLH